MHDSITLGSDATSDVIENFETCKEDATSKSSGEITQNVVFDETLKFDS